ncbi:glycosyltransferase family 2 protein [Candidatus Omnitrophota bacterium]
MNKVELSIVVPGYNEAGAIESNLKQLHAAVRALSVSFEILFVDDGSTDNTFEIVDNLKKQLHELNVISYKHNKGRGYALRQGISAAAGNFIITTESDLTWGADIVGRLYNAIKDRNCDAVIASPYMKGGQLKNVPFVRAMLSVWGNKLLAAAVGNTVHMVSGMTRIYRRECVKSLCLHSNDKEIHLEIMSKILALEYAVAEIPAILAWPQKDKRKKTVRGASFTAKKYIFSHLVFTFLERPILLFGALGVIISLAGAGLGAYLAYLRFMGILNPTRPLMTLMTLMVLGGILLFSFGLIGLQINDLRKEIYRIQRKLNE